MVPLMVPSGAAGAAWVPGGEQAVDADQREHGDRSQQGAELHHRSAPHEGAVTFVPQDHPNYDLHVGQREDEEDPGQHLDRRSPSEPPEPSGPIRISWTHHDGSASTVVDQQGARTQRRHQHYVRPDAGSQNRQEAQEHQRPADPQAAVRNIQNQNMCDPHKSEFYIHTMR